MLHFDQLLGGEGLEQAEQVALAPRGRDVVLGEECVADLAHRTRALHERPDARSHGVEAVVHARRELQDRGLAAHVTGNLVAGRHHQTGDDQGTARLHRANVRARARGAIGGFPDSADYAMSDRSCGAAVRSPFRRAYSTSCTRVRTPSFFARRVRWVSTVWTRPALSAATSMTATSASVAGGSATISISGCASITLRSSACEAAWLPATATRIFVQDPSAWARPTIGEFPDDWDQTVARAPQSQGCPSLDNGVIMCTSRGLAGSGVAGIFDLPRSCPPAPLSGATPAVRCAPQHCSVDPISRQPAPWVE